MKIVLVAWAVPPVVGGVESHLVDVAMGLGAEGHQLVIVSGERCPNRSLFALDTRFVFDPRLQVNVAQSERQGGAETGPLEDVLRQFAPDIVHAHNLYPVARSVLVALVSLRSSIGYLLFHTSHTLWTTKAPDAANWDGFFAVSDWLAAALTADGWSISSLPLPVNARRFQSRRRPLESREFKILLPGRLVPEKGSRVAVAALRVLLAKGLNAHLVLTDTPSMLDFCGTNSRVRRDLLGMASDLRREARLRFVPASWEEMPRLYEEADIVLCPSLYEEPYGLSALESMAASRPVIASRIGAFPETVRHGITGILVSAGDVSDLSSRIVEIIDSPDRARNMAIAGMKEVSAMHNIQDHVRQLLMHYQGQIV